MEIRDFYEDICQRGILAAHSLALRPSGISRTNRVPLPVFTAGARRTLRERFECTRGQHSQVYRILEASPRFASSVVAREVAGRARGILIV